ncbi:MAG: hypothetical protein ACRDN6_13225 [Gaiellaceae bacterium]
MAPATTTPPRERLDRGSGTGLGDAWKVLRIHSSGRAVVWSGHREAVELYWTQLRDLGLTMAPLER